MLVLGALLLGLTAGAEPDGPMRLSCKGYTEASSEHTTLHFLAKGGLSASTYYGEHREGQHVLFEMSDGAARVKLPRGMVTQVNSGGDDGWWKVADLKVTEGTITGWFRINIVNKPSFTIDRTTGDIDLGGAFPFKGSCEKVTQTERKF